MYELKATAAECERALRFAQSAVPVSFFYGGVPFPQGFDGADGSYTAKDTGLTCDPAWLCEVAFSESSAENCIQKLLKLHELPTAFLCAGDVFAVNIMRYAKKYGLRIPEDISIMSLDDLLIAQYVEPGLSTMTFPKELLGEMAMRLLYQILQGERYERVNLIQTTPVIRGTVKQL